MPLERLLAGVLLRLIAAYRFLLSPWVGNACRYWPTCSEYASEAIERHGAAAWQFPRNLPHWPLPSIRSRRSGSGAVGIRMALPLPERCAGPHR